MSDPDLPTAPRRKGVRRLALGVVGVVTRATMMVAVVSTFLCALTLLWIGALETYGYLRSLILAHPGPSHTEAFLRVIEIVDLFLLATVVQVVSLGLYQLYFHAELKLPAWLRVSTIDELKVKLVGVTVTVLGVFFLGEAVSWGGRQDILHLGLAVAAVVAGLSYFVAVIHRHGAGPG